MGRDYTQFLKGGMVTHDPRLGRVPFFDKRSRAFPIMGLLDEDVEIASRRWPCEKWLDQGKEGACVGFGLAHELVAEPVVVPGVTENTAKKEIYWEAQKIDDWPGGAYPGARPFYEGTTVLAGLKVVQRDGYCDEYRWAFGLLDVLRGISNWGPCVFGLDWHEGMFDTDAAGFIHATGSMMGGHCIAGVAVDVTEKSVTLRNSWGKSWGVDGECKISWDDLDRLLRAGGEAAFLVGRKIPEPRDPGPGPEPGARKSWWQVLLGWLFGRA